MTPGIYESLAWALLTFVVGLFMGGGIVYRLRTNDAGTHPAGCTGVPSDGSARRGREWARRDVHVAEPLLQESFVRHETDWRGSGMTDGKSVSFSILDVDNIRRDMTFSANLLSKFFRSGDDGPRRANFRGDNTAYSQLLAVGKFYDWVAADGSSYTWAPFLGTRERRLRTLEAWLT